jgi:hypothetical protein
MLQCIWTNVVDTLNTVSVLFKLVSDPTFYSSFTENNQYLIYSILEFINYCTILILMEQHLFCKFEYLQLKVVVYG